VRVCRKPVWVDRARRCVQSRGPPMGELDGVAVFGFVGVSGFEFVVPLARCWKELVSIIDA
jgi:hypothetical protein